MKHLSAPCVLLILFALPTRILAQDTAKTEVKDSSAKPKIASDIKPEALWDGRKLVPFKAIDFPRMVKATEADYLTDDDYILGVTINGESRAYPTRFAWYHHVINDRVGKSEQGAETAFAVTYCSVCNTGIRFDPVVKGKPRLLEFYGLYNGVVTLCDRETGSALLQVDGRFVTGPMLGTTLKMQPLLDTTWGEWKKLHPDTLVMFPEDPAVRFYSPKDNPEPRGYTYFPARYFRPTVTRGDRRLPAFDKVLAVTLLEGGNEAKPLYRAYPIKALKEADGVLNDTLGKTPVVAFLSTKTTTANAFSRLLEGKSLTFEARKQTDGGVAFFDKETGTRWNIEGRGEEGTYRGKSLTVLENHLSQWYGWSAYFPDTSVYGRTDPPQPGNPFEGFDPDKRPQKPDN